MDWVKDGERWPGGGRGSRGQVETQQRVWERTKVSSYLFICVFAYMHVCVCVCLQKLVSMLFGLYQIFINYYVCVCACPVVCMGVKVKLSELRQRCGVLGEVRLLACSVRWTVVGMVEVQSGLQLSCGEWPHRLAPGIVEAAQSHAGDRERKLHMNVGEGLDVSVDVDVNEPAWLREGERQERKEREREWWILKRGEKRTTGLSGRTGMRTHRESTRESVRQEIQTHTQTNRLNNTQQKPANLFMLRTAVIA